MLLFDLVSRSRLWRAGRIVAYTMLVIALFGCRGQAAPEGDFYFDLNVAPTPPVTGTPTVLTVTLADRSGKPITGARVSLEGNMSHAGMVPVLVEAREVSAGSYESDGFRFTMGGDWFITARIVLPGGKSFERVVDVKGVTGDKMPSSKAHSGDR